MNKVKYLAAVLITGLALQQAQATAITGNINFAGSVHFNTNNLATASSVTAWINTHSEAGNTGDFAGIGMNTPAAFTAPWVFDSGGGIGGPHPGLWSVGGFTFNLLSSTVVFRSSSALIIEGIGVVSGNGFDPTVMEWSFTTQSAGNRRIATFSFSANGVAVPDGGSAVMLLGTALGSLGVARRFFKR